jgi:hypothetical protein
MLNKLDKTYIGAILGLVLPLISFVIYWKLNYLGTFGEFLDHIAAGSRNRNNPLVFSMIPNLVVFYFSNFQLKINNFTVGLVGATLLYTIPIVISLLG